MALLIEKAHCPARTEWPDLGLEPGQLQRLRHQLRHRLQDVSSRLQFKQTFSKLKPNLISDRLTFESILLFCDKVKPGCKNKSKSKNCLNVRFQDSGRGEGAVQHRGSILAYHPAAPGLDLFSLLLSLRTLQRSKPTTAKKQISQMQLVKLSSTKKKISRIKQANRELSTDELAPSSKPSSN